MTREKKKKRGRGVLLLTIPPRNLSGIFIGDAPLQQLGEQVRELGNVLQPPGRGRDAVEVAPNADVVVPDEVADVGDVVGDVRQGAVVRVEIRDPVLIAHVDAADEVRGEVYCGEKGGALEQDRTAGKERRGETQRRRGRLAS